MFANSHQMHTHTHTEKSLEGNIPNVNCGYLGMVRLWVILIFSFLNTFMNHFLVKKKSTWHILLLYKTLFSFENYAESLETSTKLW